MKEVDVEKYLGYRQCVPCYQELHADCYNDGVCNCDCKHNQKRGYQKLRMKIVESRRKKEI